MRAAKRREDLKNEVFFILEHFEQRNIDVLIKLTRNTFESIRRRVTPPSSLLYGESADHKKTDVRPAFKVDLALAIPNVMLKPRLEDIQQSLNATVQCIVGVHKKVYQWGQEREVKDGSVLGGGSHGASRVQVAATTGQLGSPSSQAATPSGQFAAASAIQASRSQLAAPAKKKPPPELRNFFRAVSEHKEVAKLISLLSTTFSSAKIIVERALEHFKDYQHLWMEEKEQNIAHFLEGEPTLSDFEARIQQYTRMEETVKDEVDELAVGTIVLVTGMHVKTYFLLVLDYSL